MEDTEKADTEPIPINDDASPSPGKSCALCGCATPAVRCDRCNSQIFCLSCDDMYHRHPKRKFHLRKAVESIWSTSRSPRLRRRTDLPGDPSKIPIPPPRTKKRERHTIAGGRMFLKSGLELGSFGHSKVFDPKHLPTSRDFFTGQKSPASLVESNCDDISNRTLSTEPGQLYENETAVNPGGNLDDRSPWNTTRPNMSSPIQVSIPSNSPDIVTNGQSFGYPSKPHSQSAADLTGHSGHPVGPHPYHFHPPYPYMHPSMHPSMQPYSHSMAHLNCAQCISSSWSNLMSPHPSPYFHPMPWGSAQNTMSRGQHIPGQPGPIKHSHGDLVSYPDSSFHYPYSGGGYYHNGPPVVDPNFIKVLHEQAEMQKLKKEATGSKPSPGGEEMDTATSPIPEENVPSSASNAALSTEAGASVQQDVQKEDETPLEPEKPTEPWSCLHCTFINPPGIYICQVCCKTSYGNKHSKAPEEEREISHRSRDSESPLINRDALLNSPDISGFNQAQKDTDTQIENQIFESESRDQNLPSGISEASTKFTTETQTSPTTKTTDAQTQNILQKSIASSTDSIFPKQEISVQTEAEATTQNCSVATDPMISSQSLESLLSGVSAPPYHNRRAGWGRGAISFSTQSLYERGRSRSPMPRSYSIEAHNLGRNSNFASEEAMHSASQAWLYTDPMYYKPHNQGLGQPLTKEDYFDGTWGSMDKLNHRVKHKKDKGKPEQMKPKFHRSLDDLKSEKRPEIIHTQELLMLQTVKEAERCGFSLEDLHVAYLNCGKENPVYWLEDNWSSMIKNIIALAAKYGEDNEENDVGVITTTEAKDALRIHRGDIWDAVTECIENRQRKILELTVRGNFTQKQIVEALKINEGNVELAFADLVRTSTRRHKFILSPGLSEDSEDLNLYNPVEDSAVDHRVSLSPMKAAKVVSVESKTEKKKSDFLTKLSAIRQAQSDRRKAREEKEFFRDTITQDYSVESESETAVKDKTEIMSISREDSKEVEENIQDIQGEVEVEAEVEAVAETESKAEVEVEVVTKSVKEGTEDNIPVDFDTNWSESQGEWIEEYSDEQWEGEGDEQWVGLGKKFQKMEKEFEEEAMQMAALWEKEELEDDVFEEESKPQPEVETVDESDKKFDEWVKANLKVDSSEYEEEEIKEKSLGVEAVTDISFRDRIQQEVSHSSPLQHYPTEHDLSFKSQFESDWVDLPADEEIEKLAHDIVYEGSDNENKFDETEIIAYEDEKKSPRYSDQGSDGDWEKVEMEEQLQEVNELDSFAFPDKEGEFDRNVEELDQGVLESEIRIDEDSKVFYKNLENISAADASNVEITAIDTREQITDDNAVSGIREKLPSIEGDQPRPPVRRKSKLNSAAIEQALKNQAMTEIPSDIPPVLPEKTKHKDSQQKVLDIYALPDKTAKLSQPEGGSISDESRITGSPPVPQKPPRLNLSPLSFNEQKSVEEEKGLEVPHKAILSKDGSPISLSFESDSNCFADSESDTEIKLHRQKNKLRKLAKYENEFEEDVENDTAFKQQLEKLALEEKSVVLESKLDFELDDDDIDPAAIEPLPRMKDADFDPELPILLGGRGSRLSDLEDVNAPKAFREDTTRPLQLFKAVKRETPTNTLSRISPVTSIEQQDEVSFISKTNEGLPMPASSPTRFIPSSMDNAIQMESFITSTKLPDSTVYENEPAERYYYNEAVSPEQNLTGNQPLDKKEIFDTLQQADGLMSPIGMQQEVEQNVESFSPAQEQDEMAFTEMEGMSAAQDYFFGRYDEIIVAPPKKKTMKTKPPATSISKFEAMSTSEIISVSTPPSQMEQSAAAVLKVMPQSELESAPPTSAIQTSLPNHQMQKIDNQTISASTVSKEIFPPTEKVKQPVPSEPLPFAEDYLFGCYNQVVVPTKTRNTPVVSARIPKLGELRAQKEHKQSASTPTSSPAPTPEPPELPSEEPVEQVLEGDESVIPSDSASMIYDEIFHDLPPEMLYNQSFDESSIYESFQDAVEDMQDSSSITSSVVNIRPKSVHFEEPAAPVVPPRRHKPQGVQAAKPPASTGTNESYADEYLYRHYEPVTQASQAKKKLPVCREDFRMQQGFEPTEIPCDTPLMPDEQEEDVTSSEISVDIPSKTFESSKYSSECEFEDSEQPLDLVEHEDVKTEAMDISRSFVLCSEDTPASVTAISDVIAPDTTQDSVAKDNVIQSSENTESFEVLSYPEQCEEVVRDVELSGTVTESQLNNMQASEVSDIKTYESSVPSNRLEMDQFVFIGPSQDIIDDSFNLYDIQESLACDLNYVDVKGNIEDECTDDSEQEWKRNEDRKNYLNASFLKSGSSKIVSVDQEETTLDKSEMSSSVESKDPLPLVDTLKSEEFITRDQDEIKSHTDSNLKDVESENLKETSFSEEPITVRMESQNITSEVIDSQPLTDISDIAEATDLDFESNDSFRTDKTQLACENISKLEEPSLQIDKVVADFIDQEGTESVDQEFIKSIDQKVSGCIDEEMVESIDQNISESIDEEMIESVNLGITESLNQEIIESVVQPHLEVCLAVSKESSIISYVPGSSYLSSTQEDSLEYSKESDVDQDAIAAEDSDVSEDQPLDNLEDFEALGELSDDNASSHSSVSTQIAVSMKVVSKEVEGDESSLIFEQNENLESDGEVFVAISLPSTVVSDVLQEYDESNVEQTSGYEDFQKVEEIPTTVVSIDEDFDYDDSYLESKHDTIRSAELTPTPSFEEPQTERYSPEVDINETVSVAKEALEDTEICVEKSVLKEEKFYGEQKDKTKATLRSDSELEEDILQSSFDENIDQFLLETSNYPDVLEEYEYKEKIISEDGTDEIRISDINIRNEYINIGEEANKSILDYDEESKSIFVEETEADINESEGSELDVESFTEEELPLPVMTHFYDDMYQPSAKFTLLSTESIYAKYCTTESSESGSESEVVNASEVVSQGIKDCTKESQIDDISPPDQSMEKNGNQLDYLPDDEPLEKEFLDDVILYDTTDVYEEPETDYAYVADFISQDGTLYELSEEQRLEFMQHDQEISAFAETEKSVVVQEKTEIISVCRDRDESVKEQESSDVKSVKSKFSTSKSCQTEDSFEEDIFFDSFDDTFTIPSYIHLPIEIQAKPPTSDISIQCELINNEDILLSQKVSSITQIEATSLENQVATALQESPEVPKFDEKRTRQPELPVDEKEESSCESFEDSDSDIYIESPSSHDELDVSNKKGYLYAEVDSDTGFSSGSECGWTRKSEWKQKEFKKTSGSSVVEVETEVQSLQMSSSLSSTEKEISNLVQASVGESSCDDSLKVEAVETFNISEKVVISEKGEVVTEMEHSEVSPSVSTIPSEIIERAVTPIAIPQFPSFEDDVIFVEIAGNIEETPDDTQVEEISTTPTVEYFYGPLPKTIKIESPPDLNDRFYETASEFSESMSLTFDTTESFSDSISSIPLSEEQMFCTLSVDSKELTASEGLEDESFADTLASLKSEVDDSISEYYLLPDSAASVATRTSLVESENFDFAQTEMPDVSMKESSVAVIYDKDDSSNDFEVAAEKLPSVDKSKNEKFPHKPVKEPVSEIKECLIKSETKDAVHSEVMDISAEIPSKMEVNDEIFPENVENKQILDSVPDLPAQKSLISESEKSIEVSAPDSAYEQPIPNRYEPVISETKPDVPQVPSDIVRYLYYDDSITFDDDSFHTQSDNLEISSLSNEVIKPVDGDENQNVQLDADKLEKPVKEIHTVSIQSASQTKDIPTVQYAKVPKTETDLSDDLVEENKQAIQELQELETVPESNISKVNVPCIDAKVTAIEAISSAEEAAITTTGQVHEPELLAHVDVLTASKANLKFPTVEVIASENVSDLPPPAEQIHESVIHIDRQIPEIITAVNVPPKNVPLLPEQIESKIVTEQMEVKQISSQVPPVPSDIVRYLYYGDDISFEEAAQSSFHSHSDSYYVSNLPSDEIQSLTDSARIFDISTPAAIPELWQESEVSLSKPSTDEYFSDILPEVTQDSSHLSSEELFKLDSSSARDESFPPFDSSECIDNWFDMEKDKSVSSTNGKKVKRDSTSTKSSALKDSEQPCIPEYILSPKLEGDLAVGKIDIDEVTDISTHFTMTDDSDRFSDIESDTSLNFEYECISPLEVYDQIEMDDHAKDNRMFESCIGDEYEMDLQTPEVEEIPDAFQFIPAEQPKEEFIDASVPIEQEKFVECITSSEFSEHSKEQFAECLIPSELPKQLSTTITTQEHFDEVKVKVSEHVVSTEFSDQASCKKIVQEHMEEKLNEKFDECVTEFSELSKERFVECLTSSEMFDQQLSKKEAFHEIAAEHLDNELKVESTSNLQLCLKDENGNFPELVGKEVVSSDSIPSERLEKIPPTDIIECSIDKVDEMNISCYILPEEDFHVAESNVIHTSQGLEVSLQTEAAKNSEDNDKEIDVSSYASPDEDSHGIFAEVTDNWFDVETKNIEIDESVYDLPHEDLNVVDSDSNILSTRIKEKTTQESREKSIVCEAISAKSFESSGPKVIETVESDIIPSEAQRKEIKLDIEVIEAVKVQDTKSDGNAVTEDINNKFESEKSEISTTDDSLHTISEISESKEISVYDEPEFDIKEIIGDKQDEILTCSGAMEQDLKESSVSSLSSDVQNISEIKMGTESEISAALREEVNIECMSATPGSEPTSLLGKTMYDAQKVQSEEISSEKVCLDEEVVTSISSQPDSELKITTGVAMERFQLADDADIFESSPLNIIKIKDIGISKSEAKELYESTFEFSELVEDATAAKILEILPVEEKRDLPSVSLPCGKNETSEQYESKGQILAKKEISNIVATESSIEKVEIVNFKGEIPADSNKEIVEAKYNVGISPDKTLVQKEQVDFKMESGTVDFTGRKDQEETKEECTDSKAQFSTYEGDQKSETLEFRSKLEDQVSKVFMGKEIFYGDSTEIVDFKFCTAVTEEQTDIQMIETSVRVKEEAESKVIKQDKFVCSSDRNISSEIVDFKGEFVESCDIVSLKKIGSADNVPIADEKKLRFETGSQSSEIVDFKGQIVSEGITTEFKNKDESVDFKGIGLVSGKLYDAQDPNVKLKIENQFETIDFKGQIIPTCLPETKKEEATTITKKDDVEKQIDEFEIVDFKGILAADLQGMQQKEIGSIQKDTASITENIKIEMQPEHVETDKSAETISLSGSPYSGYSEINEQARQPDIINTFEDTSQIFYPDDQVYDATFYSTSADEIYGYDTSEQPVTFEELTHGYDFIDQTVVFESQELAFQDQIMTADTVNYSVSGESSELYSCAETLSAAEDTVQFYSLSDELEDTGITTSEDFTDVPSHLTESSDKWSDAEGDFSFEEAEFDRDKTPTRITDDAMITCPKENKFEGTAFYCQESESTIKSVDIKDQSLPVLDDSKHIGTSETLASKTVHENILPEESETFETISEVIPVIQTQKDVKKVIELSENVQECIEYPESKSEVASVFQCISDDKPLKAEIVKQVEEVLDQEVFGTDSAVVVEEIELTSTDKSGDLSVVTTAEDFTDVSTYQLATEGTDKWSAVESEMEHLESGAKIAQSGEENQASKIVSETNITDQVVSSNAMNAPAGDIIKYVQVEECDTEAPLMEHFADIKAIKDQLTTVDTFSSFDAETAVSKTHEDTSTDISSQFEKTESDYWLEAETEHSVSEFDDDIALSHERDEDMKLEFTDNEIIIEEMAAAIPSSQICFTETATTTSTSSSSYTDLENSDQTSDTCADISLQGATTENSDKWSDIEAEALIDDVLYGNVDITENLEVLDFPQPIKKHDDNVAIAESSPYDSQLKIMQSSLETTTEIDILSKVDTKSETEMEDVKVSRESTSELLKSKSGSSFEGPDTTSMNLTDSGQSSMPTDSSSLLLTPSNVTTTTGLSDDELTSVTPLDVEESDKWSDISGDTSVEEIDDESSVSLKAGIKLQDQVLDTASSEFRKHDESLVEESQGLDVKFKISKVSDSGEETATFTSASKEKEHITSAEFENQSIIEPVNAKETNQSEISESKVISPEEEVEIDDCSSSKVTDEFETVDNYTDVPTHTLTSEISEAYCELESDHSVAEMESQYLDPEGTGTQDIQQMTAIIAENVSEHHEDPLANEEFLENADDFGLDSVPENELEAYEDEEYSLSEHFEISEDELIYPLPYNDWIEQSFELKEYGIEAAFSESGSDIHGFGIANEEDDDEDIQRAIDYNLSTFDEDEDNAENVVTTDSFKTLSNDASPRLKVSEKEFDTWSTADAPSIDEEYAEQDNVLSKIDELLAEDFNLDTYQAESPLKDDELNEDLENYLQKDIPNLQETYKAFTQTDRSSSPKAMLLQIDKDYKVTDSETTSSEIAEKDPNSQSETLTSVTKTLIKPSDTAAGISDERKNFKSEAEEFHSSLDKAVQPIAVKNKTISSEDAGASVKLQIHDKSSKKILSTSEDASTSVTLFSGDSGKQSKDLSMNSTVSLTDTAQSVTIKDKMISSVDAEASVKLQIHDKSSKSFVSTSENASASVTLSSSDSGKQSQDLSIDSVSVSDTDQSISIKDKTISSVDAEASVKLQIHDISSKSFVSTSENASTSVTLSSSDSVKHSKDLSIDGTVSVSDTSESITTKDKTIASVDAVASVKLESQDKSSIKCLSTSEDASASVILSSSDSVKQSKDLSIDGTVSVSDTDQSIAIKNKTISSVDAVASVKLGSQDKSSIKCLSTSEGASASVTLSSSDSAKESKDLSLDSTVSVSDTDQSIAIKNKTISSADAEASVKLESQGISSIKCLSTSEDASASVTLSSSDSCNQSEDLSIVSTVSVSDTAQSVTIKDKTISSVDAETSVKLQIHDKSSKNFLSASEDASTSVTLSSSDSVKQSKDLSIDSTVSVSDTAQTVTIKDKTISSVDAEASVKLESQDKSSRKHLFTSEDASTSVILSSKDSDKQIKSISTDSTTLCVSETHSSSDIPSKKLVKSAEASEEISLEAKASTKSSEGTVQSSEQLSKSLKHSVVSAVSTAEVQSSIPDQGAHETPVESVGEKHVTTSEELTSAGSLVVEVKPDIPKKTRQRSLDSKEGTPLKDEKPSLPPKLSKRHSVSNSPSSSLGESLSSSSSVESLGSFESAASGRSRKGSLQSSEEPSMHSLSPEVPTRRSRSSKVSSSSRSTSRDSDNSAPSRSSSLKIRRRSSNFREPEPIDLSKKRASIDERMQKLQNEGKCTTREKAFIAAKLIEMQFEEEDALLASRQCNSVYHAVEFLTQLCEMCNCRFPINLMSSMMHCTHRACKDCLKAHFTSLIYDRSIFTLLCPVCQKPDITDQNIQEYFNHLDMMLRNFLEDRVYDLFQRKLRDEVLTKDPNFHWCSQCSSGFIASPRLKKLYCPDCSAITCALCHQTWELEHEGVHCERFQQWKDMHTPEPPPAGLVKFLIDRGVSCPSCGLVYAEACGGCMMYKCSHCSFEFCGFCIRPCKRGRDCSNKSCEERGLHIHHLQNCLFYLRDKDITEIQMLLEEESITYLTIPPKDQIVKSRCQVREQKNVHGVLSEDRCGRGIEPYCGGLCSTHYYEYLAELLRKNNISPLSIMTIQDLQFMLRKSRILVPEKMKGEASEEYYERLLNLVSSALT